jgi:hypothetical protein
MVQYFKRNPDPRQELVGNLGEALGMGLGNGLVNYQANKALDEVLDNEENKKAPLSEKLGLIQKAMRPFGEQGEKLFMDRLLVEQQAHQEKEQHKHKKQTAKQSNILGKLLNGEEVSDKEFAELTPEQLLAWGKHQAAVNKPSKQALSQQPIDPDQFRRIKETREAPGFTEASPTKKYQMLTENGVSSPLAKTEADIAAEDIKNAPGQEYAKGREKTIQEYVTAGLKGAEEAENMNGTISTIEKALQGDITGPGLLATLKHDPYGQLFFGLTPDEATLTAANKYMLEGTKGIFGSKPTEREIFTLLNGMLPSVGKTKEANLAGLQVIKSANEIKAMRSELISSLTDGGKNFVPDIENQVNQKMKPIVEEFRKEMYELKDSLLDSEKKQNTKAKEGKIRVQSPPDKDGKTRIGYMTQQQIDAAKAKNVIFSPVQ